MAAISTTCELASEQSPTLKSEGEYIMPLQLQLEGFSQTDAPAIPQLAVLVSLLHHIHHTHQLSSSTLTATTANLSVIAFYYLLRVGKYTQPRKVKVNGKWHQATCTEQFCVGDVGFFKDGKVLPRQASLKTLITADSATLKISNQKNGRMGQTIHQEGTGQSGAVAALARWVHHILQHGGTESNLLCAVFQNKEWTSVTSTHVINLLCAAVKQMKLSARGINPDLIGMHSLRAGGAMALKLQNYSDTIIQKLGRWSSATWLQYIHNQISHLSSGVAHKMSENLPFLNIAFIEPAKPI